MMNILSLDSVVDCAYVLSFWEKITAEYCCPLQRMPLFITKNIVHNACLTGNTHNIHWSKFTYKIPLAYQKTILTENAKDGWRYVYPIVNTLFYKPFRLDTKVQPGHDYLTY